MIITLTADIEEALVQRAREMGKTPEGLALESLRERFVSSVEPSSTAEDRETLADFLAGHIGVLHSRELIPGGAQMSEKSGRRFAAGMVEKRRQGRL